MLATAYLLAGPATPERDILPIQVGGGEGGWYLPPRPHRNSSVLHPRQWGGHVLKNWPRHHTGRIHKQGYVTATLYFSQMSDI